MRRRNLAGVIVERRDDGFLDVTINGPAVGQVQQVVIDPEAAILLIEQLAANVHGH